MFDGYLLLGGTEIINKARTAAYILGAMPGVEVNCRSTDIYNALGHNPYTDPATDGAPWYRSQVPDTAKFLGFFPGTISGAEDSTRELTITELMGDGAVQSLPRHGSREIRVRGKMFARDEAGMDAGMAWLRAALDDQPCGANKLNCEGRDLEFFTADPSASTEAAAIQLVAKYGRIMYRVEPLDGPRVVGKEKMRNGLAWEIEYVLNAGVPWVFTYPEPLAITTGVTPVAANEVYCPTQTDAYDDLVTDPTSPGVSRPPRPPQIETITMPANWSRYTMTIGQSYGQRAGRLVPVLTVTTGTSVARKLRVRFYRTGNSGVCDYEGEFFISYIPANSVLTIDGTKRETWVRVAGADKPAGNLVTGSDGRPANWPTLACNSSYQIVVDSVGGLGTTSVLTEIAVRE